VGRRAGLDLDARFEMGRPETDITNFIHRAKQRLRREIESLIREYSGGDVKTEIAALMQYL